MATLGERLMAGEAAIRTAALPRLWGLGRGAAGVAGALRRSGQGGELDPEAVAALVSRFGELKGVAMKAGQLLSYVDQSVPPELRDAFASLQTAAARTPLADVRRTIETSLGDRAAPLLAGLEPAPVAVASIGQVHRAVLPDGTPVAVKVRHPGIREALEADFRSASAGVGFAKLVGGESVPGFVAEAREAFLEECDFAREADTQEAFAAALAGDPDLVVPTVVRALSGDAVLVTHWTPGRSLDAFLSAAPTQAERDRAGAALFRFWFRTLYADGLFHADPHPGNFAFTEDGRIVVYDYGCARRLEPGLRRAFAGLASAVRAGDPDAILRALESTGARAPAAPAERERLVALLRGFFGPLLAGGARTIAPDEALAARQLLSDKRLVARLGLPPKFLFLFRLRFGLYAVLSRLGACVDWGALEAAWAAEFATSAEIRAS